MENVQGTNLARVLQYYGLIDYVGNDVFKVVCPFHQDINPSMIIDLEKGKWFCFGCNLSGDALKFVKYAENIGQKTNDLQCCKTYIKILNSNKVKNISIGLRIKRQSCKQQQLTEAIDFYYNLSAIDWTKRPTDKHARESIIYMCCRGFSLRTLTGCGCKYTYSNSYPLIFPMLDNGEFKGWVCRTTSKGIEKKRKYLYNEGFSRRTTLCGNYNKDNGYLYVVEGYMDMLKMRTFGVNNVVAILGWKMTNEQILKLKSAGFKQIISALDNDECGKKGTEFLRSYFKVIRFCFEDGIKDPGDMDIKMFDRMNNRTLTQII